jgi:hypothetical protein
MEGSGSIPIITDPDPGGPKTARAGRQQEQGNTKSRVTARAGRQQEQGNSKSTVTQRAGRQQDQSDSNSRATT